MKNKKSNHFEKPSIIIDKQLEVFKDKILFPEKLAKANAMLVSTKLPHKFVQETNLHIWQQQLLDERLKDYQDNPTEVEDFDKTLMELFILVESSKISELQKFTQKELIERALEANMDIKAGRGFSQEEVEKLSNNWDSIEDISSIQKQKLAKRYTEHLQKPYEGEDVDEFLKAI